MQATWVAPAFQKSGLIGVDRCLTGLCLHWHCAHVILFSQVYSFYSGAALYKIHEHQQRRILQWACYQSVSVSCLLSVFLLLLQFAPELPPFAVLVLIHLLLRLPRLQLNTLCNMLDLSTGCLAFRIFSLLLYSSTACLVSFLAAFSFSSRCLMRSEMRSASWFINQVANTRYFRKKVIGASGG